MPKTIGRYERREELGKGGMGVVYRAYDLKLKRDVALKVLLPDILPSNPKKKQKKLDRFEREAKTMASLEYNGIVTVYDFGEEKGQPFFVMELMEEGSLIEKLKKPGYLSLSEIDEILTQLASALDYMHKKNIVHRDIKPSNILFNKEGRPCIADFGIAKLTEASPGLTATGELIGTPAYMSPEQASGDTELDGRSDIYALGCILFQMLTGERPYYQVDPMGLLHYHIYGPIPRLDEVRSDLPDGFQAIIDKAMAKDREDRYPTASALSNAIKALITEQNSPQGIGDGKKETLRNKSADPNKRSSSARAIQEVLQGQSALLSRESNEAKEAISVQPTQSEEFASTVAPNESKSNRSIATIPRIEPEQLTDPELLAKASNNSSLIRLKRVRKVRKVITFVAAIMVFLAMCISLLHFFIYF